MHCANKKVSALIIKSFTTLGLNSIDFLLPNPNSIGIFCTSTH